MPSFSASRTTGALRPGRVVPIGRRPSRRARVSADQSDRRDALLSADDAPLRACVDGPDVQQGFEEWDEIFGDDVMAAALIDRLVHHCHLVTIRGNSYRMRQHTELWQTLHAPQDPEPAARRRRARQRATTN